MTRQERQILKLLAARSVIKAEKKQPQGEDDLSLDGIGLVFIGTILLIPVFIVLINRMG